MKMRFWLTATLVLFAAGAAQALPITYEISRLSLNHISLTGTITTDGTEGALTAGNISEWNITITVLSESADLTQLNSSVTVVGDALVATTTEITFDFGRGTLSRLSFAAPVFPAAWDLRSTSPSWTFAIETWSAGRLAQIAILREPTIQTIATAAAVPEPSAALLFAVGFSLVAHRVRARATRGSLARNDS